MIRPTSEKLREYSIFGAIFIVILVLIFLVTKPSFYYQARSYIAMYAFSQYEEKNSLLEKQGIKIEIPGGLKTKQRDWYPFVMVFNDDAGFSQYMGRELSMTVLYNFGAFPWHSKYSDFFRKDSPYYNSFYGGYLVKEKARVQQGDATGDNIDGNPDAHSNNPIKDKKYGFLEDGALDISEIFSVPEYDFKHLVIQSLGCPVDQLSMEIISYDVQEDVQIAGYEDWVQIDARLRGNRPDHRVKEKQRSYIQYGYPPKPEGQDFGLMETYGRIYIRYAKEFQCTLFLYILSPDLSTIEKCDSEILSKTTISY